MSDLSADAEIMQMFVDESLEALQRVERLLLDAEEGQPRADMVDVMFRDMHTIKGTAALLGFERTTALAHAAEDLMCGLRDKSITAHPHHFAVMVKTVDHLRQYVESTRDQSNEGTADCSAVVGELKRFTELGNTAFAVEPVPTPTPVPLAQMPTPVPVSAPPPVATAAAATPEPDDEALARPSAPQPAAKATEHKASAEDGTVRVNVGVLDKLMNLMGELVLTRNQMVQLMRNQRDAVAQSALQRLSLVTTDLQQQIMKTRMQPVARVFEKIPRQVRDLAQQTGKKVVVEIEGTTTELDKALVEAIRDPLMHIIRNAMDHGIELPADREAKGKSATGKLTVRAVHEGNSVSIEIKDDGRGVDPAIVKRVALSRGVITQAEADVLTEAEAIDLLFRPGFSTAEKVTSISGRGVGMDVVRSHVERAGGKVELESELGKGATVRLKMPLTLAIIPALLVKDGDQRFAVPQANLIELVRMNAEQAKTQIEYVRGAPIIRLRGEILPLVRLAPLLGRPVGDSAALNLVVVEVGQRRYGLAVDAIHDTEEIVIKPLHRMLKKLACYAGATVLGDGGMALILDVAGVASMAGIDLTGSADRTEKTNAASGDAQSMLIAQIGDGVRCAVPVSMVARLEQVERTALERVAGTEVLQYRGDIMQIIRPETAMPVGDGVAALTDMQQLLVFDFGRPIGLAVNAILDATEVTDVRPSEVPHTLGNTVVFGKTTLLLDVLSLVQQLAPACLERKKRPLRRPRVLLSDEMEALRGSIAGFLRASGVDVTETTGEALVRELRGHQRGFDAVIASLDPISRGLELVRTVKREVPDLPIVCVSRDDVKGQAEAAGARTCVRHVEREAILDVLDDAGLFQLREAA